MERVLRRPDAMVDDQNVQPAQGTHGGFDERAPGCRRAQLLFNGDAVGRRGIDSGALGDQCCGLFAGPVVIEGHAGAGLHEEPHNFCADATRSAGDEGRFALQRQRNTIHFPQLKSMRVSADQESCASAAVGAEWGRVFSTLVPDSYGNVVCGPSSARAKSGSRWFWSTGNFHACSPAGGARRY